VDRGYNFLDVITVLLKDLSIVHGCILIFLEFQRDLVQGLGAVAYAYSLEFLGIYIDSLLFKKVL